MEKPKDPAEKPPAETNSASGATCDLPDLLDFPAGLLSSGDPCPKNPFPADHPGYKAWEDATGVAEVEKLCFNSNLSKTRPDRVDAGVGWLRGLVVGKFDVWARRGVKVVWDGELLAKYDEWLIDYARAWLHEVREFLPSTMTFDALFPELRLDLIGRIEWWKTEARRYLAVQKAHVASTGGGGGPASNSKGAPLAQAAQPTTRPGGTEPAQGQAAKVAAGADGGGASWQVIEISFLSDERVQILNGAKTETCNYAELGFADERNGKPNMAWKALQFLAESGGIIRGGIDGPKVVKQRQGTHAALQFSKVQGRTWTDMGKRIQEIRKVLRKHFHIAADPISLVKGTGYKARFKIDCNPSYHT